MPIIAKQESDNFEKIPTGTIQAVCVFVHDIGFQQGEYQGKPNIAHKVIVSWELNETMSLGANAGKRFMINKYYTLSLSEKANLRKDLESWRGKAFTQEELDGFDIEKLRGANCLLSIVENDKGKRKVAGVSSLPKGMPVIVPTLTEPSEKYMEWIQRERDKSIQPATLPPDPAPDPNVAHTDRGDDLIPF